MVIRQKIRESALTSFYEAVNPETTQWSKDVHAARLRLAMSFIPLFTVYAIDMLRSGKRGRVLVTVLREWIADWRRLCSHTIGNIYGTLRDSCDAVFIHIFDDGKIAHYAFAHAQEFLEQNKVVFGGKNHGEGYRIERISVLDPNLRLSIMETGERYMRHFPASEPFNQ